MVERMSYNPDQESDDDLPEVTPSRAFDIFETAMISRINEELKSSGQQIIARDGSVKLEWFVDEQTPDGRFAIAQSHKPSSRTQESVTGKHVLVEDKNTGEKYVERKLSGQVMPPEERGMKMSRVYDLKTDQVRGVFHKLKPEVQKSFTDGLKEALSANTRLLEALQMELKDENSTEDKNDLETQLKEQEIAQENLKKELQALA